VVIDNFHVFRPAPRPAKAHPPLPIDADAVLAGAIAFQRLEF
jgi:hypothetical protein